MDLTQVIPKDIVKYNEPMSRHTSFRIGGPADILVMPGNIEEIMAARRWARERGIPCYIMGAGTNLLVKDGGFRGMIIKLGSNFKGINIKGTKVKALSGTRMSELARRAAEHGLSGLEFAEGIPGTLGGAVCMNAGAYGGEIGSLVNMVRVLDGDDVREIGKAGLAFDYRKSSLQGSGMIVLEAELGLTPGDPEKINAAMHEFARRRKEKQPLEWPSAGSVFRRPEGHYVGPMIEELGLKGFQIGGAAVSEKHAGFIINRGGATARDVLNLIRLIQDRVKEKYGVELHPEIEIIGED